MDPNVEKDKQTSSNKPGFYSNDASQTYVSYTAGMMTGLKAKYEKPVIQVDPESIHIPEESNPIDGSITKVMGTVREDGKYPINLQVKTRLEETSKQANVDVILVIDNSNSMDGNRLSQTKIAANAFVNGFVGADGNVSENGTLNSYTITIDNKATSTYTAKYEGGKTEVSNITVVDKTTDINNTKLSELPSTGGIGTTIFTIGGCIIMIVAAGLFFASRRKSAK